MPTSEHSTTSGTGSPSVGNLNEVGSSSFSYPNPMAQRQLPLQSSTLNGASNSEGDGDHVVVIDGHPGPLRVQASSLINPDSLQETTTPNNILAAWKSPDKHSLEQFEILAVQACKLDPIASYASLKRHISSYGENSSPDTATRILKILEKIMASETTAVYYCRYWKLYLNYAKHYQSQYKSEMSNQDLISLFYRASKFLTGTFSIMQSSVEFVTSEQVPFPLRQSFFTFLIIHHGAHPNSYNLWKAYLDHLVDHSQNNDSSYDEQIPLIQLELLLALDVIAHIFFENHLELVELFINISLLDDTHLSSDLISRKKCLLQLINPTLTDGQEFCKSDLLWRAVYIICNMEIKKINSAANAEQQRQHLANWQKNVDHLTLSYTTINGPSSLSSLNLKPFYIPLFSFVYRVSIRKLLKYRCFSLVRSVANNYLSHLDHVYRKVILEKNVSAIDHYMNAYLSKLTGNISSCMMEIREYVQDSLIVQEPMKPENWLFLAKVVQLSWGADFEVKKVRDSIDQAQKILINCLDTIPEWRAYPPVSIISACVDLWHFYFSELNDDIHERRTALIRMRDLYEKYLTEWLKSIESSSSTFSENLALECSQLCMNVMEFEQNLMRSNTELSSISFSICVDETSPHLNVGIKEPLYGILIRLANLLLEMPCVQKQLTFWMQLADLYLLMPDRHEAKRVLNLAFQYFDQEDHPKLQLKLDQFMNLANKDSIQDLGNISDPVMTSSDLIHLNEKPISGKMNDKTTNPSTFEAYDLTQDLYQQCIELAPKSEKSFSQDSHIQVVELAESNTDLIDLEKVTHQVPVVNDRISVATNQVPTVDQNSVLTNQASTVDQNYAVVNQALAVDDQAPAADSQLPLGSKAKEEISHHPTPVISNVASKMTTSSHNPASSITTNDNLVEDLASNRRPEDHDSFESFGSKKIKSNSYHAPTRFNNGGNISGFSRRHEKASFRYGSGRSDSSRMSYQGDRYEDPESHPAFNSYHNSKQSALSYSNPNQNIQHGGPMNMSLVDSNPSHPVHLDHGNYNAHNSSANLCSLSQDTNYGTGNKPPYRRNMPMFRPRPKHTPQPSQHDETFSLDANLVQALLPNPINSDSTFDPQKTHISSANSLNATDFSEPASSPFSPSARLSPVPPPYENPPDSMDSITQLEHAQQNLLLHHKMSENSGILAVTSTFSNNDSSMLEPPQTSSLPYPGQTSPYYAELVKTLLRSISGLNFLTPEQMARILDLIQGNSLYNLLHQFERTQKELEVDITRQKHELLTRHQQLLNAMHNSHRTRLLNSPFHRHAQLLNMHDAEKQAIETRLRQESEAFDNGAKDQMSKKMTEQLFIHAAGIPGFSATNDSTQLALQRTILDVFTKIIQLSKQPQQQGSSIIGNASSPLPLQTSHSSSPSHSTAKQIVQQHHLGHQIPLQSSLLSIQNNQKQPQTTHSIPPFFYGQQPILSQTSLPPLSQHLHYQQPYLSQPHFTTASPSIGLNSSIQGSNTNFPNREVINPILSSNNALVSDRWQYNNTYNPSCPLFNSEHKMNLPSQHGFETKMLQAPPPLSYPQHHHQLPLQQPTQQQLLCMLQAQQEQEYHSSMQQISALPQHISPILPHQFNNPSIYQQTQVNPSVYPINSQQMPLLPILHPSHPTQPTQQPQSNVYPYYQS